MGDLNMTKLQIGQRIARIRETRGYSQRSFSAMIGLDRVTLSRIESGTGNPTIGTLQRIADGLGTEVPELFRSS